MVSEKQNDQLEKNAFLVKVRIKLPDTIKKKIKKIGAIWQEAHQGYVCPIEHQEVIKQTLDPWKIHLTISEISVDPVIFSHAGKTANRRSLRISILEKEVYEETRSLLADVYAYNSDLRDNDFDELPSQEGKSSETVQIEAVFYERRRTLLEKKKELEALREQGEGPFILDEEGLWYEEGENGKMWLSSPIRIVARVRDDKSLNHGKLVAFEDADGILHELVIGMELLAGDCVALRGYLLSAGLEIATSHKARQLFSDYLLKSDPSATVRCVPRTGWFKGGFVLPDVNIGDFGFEQVRLQAKAITCEGYGVSGTLRQWQNGIADLCVGNNLLIFAVSAGFAAPVLSLVGLEPGGFHFCSHSSSGKTTLLRVAASLYGSEKYLQKWKATINGLEAVAAQHNDTLLCLDELGEMDGRAAGEAAYMLANGAGKRRAKAEGGIRDTLTWTLLFLSSGEIGLAEHMESAGKLARAGQEIRLAEIPADTGAFGAFDCLHGFPDGSVFAETLKKHANQFYGTPIREFLKLLTKDLEGAKAFIDRVRKQFLEEAVSPNANGQVHRVAGRFALVAAAGELAIEYNITRVLGSDGMASVGWDVDSAYQATLKCFKSWLESFGGDNLQEETHLLAHVRYFLEQHGESRFTRWEDSDEDRSRTHQRAGYRKQTGDKLEYYFFPETFKRDICMGKKGRFVTRTLHKHGLLTKDQEGKYSCSGKPAGEPASKRFYVISLPVEDEGEG